MKYRFLLACLLIVAILLGCGPSDEEEAAQITQIAAQVLSTQAAQFTPTPTMGAGSSRYFDKDGMFMVYVPGGEYMLGSDQMQVEQAYEESKPLLDGKTSFEFENEFPNHTVSLDPFWIDQTEVTNAMFARFVAETGYLTTAERLGYAYNGYETDPPWQEIGADWRHPLGTESNLEDLDAHPVVQISWYDAWAYCTWAGKRLPTEAEWEAAARGPDALTYPWGGNRPDGLLANMAYLQDGWKVTAPVGSYPDGASPFQVFNLAGNVREWVYDGYAPDYGELTDSQNPINSDTLDERVVRGGSFGSYWIFGRAATRIGYEPLFSAVFLGFRCVDSNISLPEPPPLPEIPRGEIIVLDDENGHENSVSMRSEPSGFSELVPFGTLKSSDGLQEDIIVLAQYDNCNWLKVTAPSRPEGWIEKGYERNRIILYKPCSEIEEYVSP